MAVWDAGSGGRAEMYAPGMTRRASGLGQVSTDVLANLPMTGPETSMAYQAAFTAPQYTVAAPPSTQFTSWINANAVTLLIVSGALFLALGVSRR